MAYEEPTTKKFKHSIISKHIFEPEFQEVFYKHWHGRTEFKDSRIEIVAEPFRVCKISNFLKSVDFMEELKSELIDVKFRRNSIDLYQFEQSNDLVKADSNNIKTLYHTFQTNLSEWMQKNTEIVLNETISMSSSCYCDTDYLLCHDDNLGDRRIAFILYLCKDWTEKDGGALDLFDTDEDGLPRNVVKSIIPEYNSLVMFEVVNNSYHQVAEVTSPVKTRWTINGWFHGPIVPSEKVQRPEPVINYVEPENTEVDLSQWISQNYLYPEIVKQIKERVEKESYTFLSNFLKENVYKRLLEEIQSADIKWKRVGPADVRNYEVADEDSLPETLANFCRIFKSITVFQLLKSYTELDLVPETEAMNPRVTIELQRWSRGCYTLINDKYNNEEDNADTVACSDKRTAANTSEHDDEAAVELEGESSSPPEAELSRLQHNSIEEHKASEKSVREEVDCNTPPSSPSDDDESEEEELAAKRCRPKEKTLKKKRSVAASQQLSPAKVESERRNLDTDDDSDVSDIGDYLSDSLDDSSERSEQKDAAEDEEVSGNASDAGGACAEEDEIMEPGSLDVIMQFNTGLLGKEGIDYVDPREEDTAFIQVPPKDNHLCLVYKTVGTCRVHRYVNHYFKEFFYNLVCTYLE